MASAAPTTGRRPPPEPLLSELSQEALRRQSLPKCDFTQPDRVLAALNRAFPMEQHAGRFFTICGPGYRKGRQFFWREVAGDIVSLETTSVSGRGKDDLVVRFDPTTEGFETFPSERSNANVRQMLGRPGEAWGAESGLDRLVVFRYPSG